MEYEFSAANIKGNIIEIPEYIIAQIPKNSKIKMAFDGVPKDSHETKWDFAISHDKFWTELGILPDIDLSDVEAYEIE